MMMKNQSTDDVEGSNAKQEDRKEPRRNSNIRVSPQNEKKKEASEHRAVGLIRWILAVVLASSAITVSALVYVYKDEKEKDDFRSQFESDAEKVRTGLSFSSSAQESFVMM